MSISRERQSLLKNRTRQFAVDVLVASSPFASEEFDDLGLSKEEELLIDNEVKAIARRVFATIVEGPDNG